MEAPVFFHISPDWCGATRLAELFYLNGYPALLGPEADLAADILMAEARDVAPLARHRGVRLFAGLHRHVPHWRPPLEAWRSFAYLARTFPQARFILTTRAPEGWILDRLTRDQGAVARCHAYYRGVSEADLPDLWLADWQAHLAAVDGFFENDPRLLRVDLDRETPEHLAARLSDLLFLPEIPQELGWYPGGDGPTDRALYAALDRVRETGDDDPEYIRDMAEFCLRGTGQGIGDLSGVSGYFCAWDGTGKVQDREGGTRQMVIADPPGLGRAAIARQDVHFKILRAEGVINDALYAGRPMPLSIDMEDSRWLGSPDGPALPHPVIGHCRREGARNMVLWPLPGQHSIGLPGFDPSAASDPIPFEDKRDRLVWRGMISGSEMRGTIRPGPASHVFLRRLAEAGDDVIARQQAFEGLCRTSRMAFIRRFWKDADFDIGIVMAWGFRDFARDPLLAPYCVPRRGSAFFRQYRYQLCLTGYDHGSNFIPMIDSQSVLLKEEDGWEVFYSGRFKPWKHYIPVARYCADLPEKLAWARENPSECKRMSAEARFECARLRNARLRRGIHGAILDGLAGLR